MSKEYEAALKVMRMASAAFRSVQDLYRFSQIGDAEYLAARKIYEKSQAAFDVAFNKESA